MQDNIKLFDLVYETVTNECGDGDMAIVLTAQDHKVVADQFQQYLLEHHSKWGVWERTNHEDGDITFSCQQESFTFSNKDHFCSWSDLTNFANCQGKVPCTSKVIVP